MVRGSIILNNGELLYPPPPSSVPIPSAPPTKTEVKPVVIEENPFNTTLKTALACTAGTITTLLVSLLIVMLS